jgi:hypothetical protein
MDAHQPNQLSKEMTMDSYSIFPDKAIEPVGPVSQRFVALNLRSFLQACEFVHGLPYGYNSNRDDLFILFSENMGSCTTKHAVIATLAQELHLDIHKTIGIYAMTEAIVTGTQRILDSHGLPYLPMVHCFLRYEHFQVDLTEGNRNGKNQSIETFLYQETVEPNISAKTEYLLYRRQLQSLIDSRPELHNQKLSHVLRAREDGLELLRSKVH